METGHLKSACFGEHDGEGRDYVVLLPPDYDKAEKLPLLMNLHGGGGSSQHTAMSKPLYEGYWAAGTLPRCVVATFSSLRGAGWYHDYHNGSLMYMKFFMEEWLPFLRASYGVSTERSHTWLTGTSMGGIGSLRLSFSHPDVFAGVAACEPAVDPVFDAADLLPRNILGRGDFPHIGGPKPVHGSSAAETEALFGALDSKDWDAASYHSFNPASLLRANAQAIRDHRLKIFIEAADEDIFNLHEGAEFLHQVLWKFRVPHEYRLITEADHMGSTLMPRLNELHEWLGTMMRRAMDPQIVEPTPGQALFLNWLEDNKIILPTPDMKPPEGAEPLTVVDDVFLQWLRKQLPEHVTEHFNPVDGWGRLPEATVRRAKRG